MFEFIRAGGVPILGVVLFGIIGLVAAAAFARRPDPRSVETLKALSATQLFMTVAAVVSDFGSVMWKVPNDPQWAHSPDLRLIVMTGLGEASTPGILGFTVLAVVWLLIALGFHRLARTA